MKLFNWKSIEQTQAEADAEWADKWAKRKEEGERRIREWTDAELKRFQTLPDFDPHATCPKCGSEDIQYTYQHSGIYWGRLDAVIDVKCSRLERTCGTCKAGLQDCKPKDGSSGLENIKNIYG